MIGRLLVILGLIAAFVIWQRWRRLNTRDERKGFISRGLVFGLVAVICALAALGRIDVLGAVFASLLLLLKYILAFAIRHIPLLARIYGLTGGFGLGRVRTLKTAWLVVLVDFSTRRISGRVVQGSFAHRQLDELERSDLEKLLTECREDARSTYFLQMYMAQRFGARSEHSNTGSQPGSGTMSREEALEILGLEGSPSEEDIKLAHKKLMQKLHPDRGGNDFLASLLNRARECLLGK